MSKEYAIIPNSFRTQFASLVGTWLDVTSSWSVFNVFHLLAECYFFAILNCTEKPLTVIVDITPSNESSITAGDTVRCSVGDNDTAADNYAWIDSATGHVIHHGAEWIVKPCINDGDGGFSGMMVNCVTYIDGLLMMECHVTVGMTTASKAVALYLQQVVTTASSTTSSINSYVYIIHTSYNK